MTEASHRRLRFGLRAMFVVVTICALALGWLTWNLRQMRNRIDVAQSIELRGGRVDWGWNYKSELKKVPAVWRFLGAEPMFSITLPATEFTREEAADICEIFPEAFVTRHDPAWEHLAEEK
jgi:hypothetical protein